MRQKNRPYYPGQTRDCMSGMRFKLIAEFKIEKVAKKLKSCQKVKKNLSNILWKS